MLGKHSVKQQNHLNKLKLKFKFLGKFVAKAIMDFRVLDLPLSTAFYKLLIDKASICEDDLKYVDAQLHSSVQSLRDYVRQRRQLLYELNRSDATSSQRDEAEKKLAELEKVNKLNKTLINININFSNNKSNNIGNMLK